MIASPDHAESTHAVSIVSGLKDKELFNIPSVGFNTFNSEDVKRLVTWEVSQPLFWKEDESESQITLTDSLQVEA